MINMQQKHLYIILGTFIVVILALIAIGGYFWKQQANLSTQNTLTTTDAGTKPVDIISDEQIGEYVRFQAKRKTYFHSTPNIKDTQKVYILEGDKGVFSSFNGDFGFALYTNSNGATTKGWVLLKDVDMSQERNKPISINESFLSDNQPNECSVVTVDVLINPKGNVVEAVISKGVDTEKLNLRNEALSLAKKVKFEPALSTTSNRKASILFKFNVSNQTLISQSLIEMNEQEEPKEPVPSVNEKPFVTVEQMPIFPGGEREMQKFIAENLKYPIVAQESGIQGRITVRFIVTKTGEISDVTIIRGIDPSCDKEAIRLVKAMPKWIPGKQNGQNVPVYFTLPIVFRLEN